MYNYISVLTEYHGQLLAGGNWQGYDGLGSLPTTTGYGAVALGAQRADGTTAFEISLPIYDGTNGNEVSLSGFINIPGPPPNGRSSHVRWRS